MVYFLWMKGPNESAFLSLLWGEAAGCKVSLCQTSVFYIHATHRRVRLNIWLRVKGRGERRKTQRRRRTSTTRNGTQEGDVQGTAVEMLPHHLRLFLLWTADLGQRRNWSWCQGEGSECRANICCNGLDFLISNIFSISVSKSIHRQFCFLFRVWQTYQDVCIWWCSY